MEQAVEWFVAITAIVMGLSHVVRPDDWATAFGRLHALARTGALVNGWLSLTVGAIIAAGHCQWEFPGAVITAFGWLLVAKGTVCLLAPEKALRSMRRGAKSPRSFVFAGVVLLAVGVWSCYCLWSGMRTA